MLSRFLKITLKCTLEITLKLTLSALLLVVVTAPAAARDVFVNNQTGDDRSTGRTPTVGPMGGPVRTIRCALALVTKGGHIVLAKTDTPYCESICLSGVEHRGFAGRPLVIDGNGATLDGTVVAASGAWKHVRDDVYAMRPRRLAYQQLFESGKPLRRVEVASWSAGPPHLEPLQWSLLGGHFYLCVEENRLPQQYELRHAGLSTGISLYNTQHVRIQNIVVQGFHTDGINAADTVRDCQLVDVECRANGRSGISIGGASRVKILRANCYDNGRSQLRTEGYCRVALRDCDLAGWNLDEGDEASEIPALDVRSGQLTIDGDRYLP